MKTSGTISDATRAQMKAAHGGPQMRAHMEKFGDLRTKAKQILTPTQIESLHSVQLGVGMGHEGFMGEREGATGGFGGGEEAVEPHHGRGGFMKHLVMGHIVTSDAFVALVEARAR